MGVRQGSRIAEKDEWIATRFIVTDGRANGHDSGHWSRARFQTSGWREIVISGGCFKRFDGFDTNKKTSRVTRSHE